MAKLNLNPGARAHLEFLRALTTDVQGNEHLVGLTLEETAWYLEYSEARARDEHRPRTDGKTYLELVEKHERARMQVVGAENELRVVNPTRQ